MLALVGQWGLHQQRLTVGWLAMPGFIAGMLLGVDGEPGETPLTPSVEVAIDTLFYFLLMLTFSAIANKLHQRKAP